MTLPLFHLAELAEAEAEALLRGSEGRHAARSMRMTVGEELELADGVGTRATGTIISVDGDDVHVALSAKAVEERPLPSVTLVQALAKGGRDEMAVEICTELGADRFIPWQADRSISRWDKARAAKGRDKWQAQAFSAAKQARRTFFPTVDAVVTSKQLATLIEASPQTVICHEEATKPIQNVEFGNDVMVVVGPEGGISPEELDAFVRAGATPVSLGRTILRTSTAGALATAAINIVSGRLT